ncbi:MAG: DnaA/Hda family protein [Planctomycetaceae bacterium]|nr:DnaA/Hda family protein [Planctomycetaceae bacterium]
MTLLGTDIEQGIREAIVGTLGPMRCEMWLGKETRIDILETCVQIHAVNSFAADWVGKSYLSAIQNQCRSFLANGQHIVVVSREPNGLSKDHPTEWDHRTTKMPHETPATQPRFDPKLLTQKRNNSCGTQRFSGVPDSMSTKQVTCSFLEDSTTVTSHAACEKRVELPISSSGKGKKKSEVSHTAAVSTPKSVDEKNLPPTANRQPVQQRKNRAKSTTTTCQRLTPQELNGQIVSQGKAKLADMTSLTESRSTATQSCRNTPSGISNAAQKVSGERVPPALKRDEANRNVVVVSGGTQGRTKATPNNAPAWDSFVVGPSNRLAVRAAELAIHHAGQISPIYIHGPTSVGKTHLLEMIKSGVRRNPQTRPLVMMTAEQFTSSFISDVVISKQGTPLFRNKFRDISALLIDDIQFFAGKESTQTEFLRTMDQLKSQGVQIVLTGDRPLNSLADLLKPEIIARLEAGMDCEIKPADHGMLLAIFKQMAVSRNLTLSDEVCEYVVSHLTTHARQLSGAINRLHATLLTTHRPITRETVETILEDVIRNNRRPVRLQDIEKAVCETMQLNGQLLQSKSRAKQVTQPRMLAMWLARKYTRSALSEIGKYFGNRSHSTVVAAQKKVDQWLRESPDFGLADSPLTLAEAVRKVERRLQAH